MTVEAQIAETEPGRWELTVTTGHQGDTFTTGPVRLRAQTSPEAWAEADHVMRAYRAAILGAAD